MVTKFFPASDVRLLADLGVTDVGENRHQEAEAKAAECADLGLRWHFVGTLQSNKAAAVARLRRRGRVRRPGQARSPGWPAGRAERGAELDCLVQVNLDPPGAAAGPRAVPRPTACSTSPSGSRAPRACGCGA